MYSTYTTRMHQHMNLTASMVMQFLCLLHARWLCEQQAAKGDDNCRMHCNLQQQWPPALTPVGGAVPEGSPFPARHTLTAAAAAAVSVGLLRPAVHPLAAAGLAACPALLLPARPARPHAPVLHQVPHGLSAADLQVSQKYAYFKTRATLYASKPEQCYMHHQDAAHRPSHSQWFLTPGSTPGSTGAQSL
jgi:hypothetical protein